MAVHIITPLALSMCVHLAMNITASLQKRCVPIWYQPGMQKAGIPVTIDPFYATKQIYGQLYAALAKQPATGTFIGLWSASDWLCH